MNCLILKSWKDISLQYFMVVNMEYHCILIQLFAVIQTDFKIIELWDFDDCESHG